ncbi:MAG: glycosyltransferase family 25 protein [Pseudomonadota bacterium]
MSEYSFVAYVIALAHERPNADRLEGSLRRSGFTGLVQHIPAIDGWNMSARNYFDHTKYAFSRAGQLLTPGEVGCALSHLVCLQHIVDSQRTGLILEHDAVLMGNFLSHASAMAMAPGHRLMILASAPRFQYAYDNAEHLAFDSVMGRAVLKVNRHMFYAAAYLVTPQAAQALIQKHDQGLYRSDDWYELLEASPIQLYFEPVFMHPDDPSKTMNDDRQLVSGSALDRLLKNDEQFVFEKVSAKKLLRHRLSRFFRRA